MEPINVLCLHGCRQNADDFRKHLKDFCKISKNAKINLFFIDGPFNHQIRGKTWVIREKEQNDEWLPDFYDPAKYQMSIDIIIDNIITHNCTVLLGFSEGACMIDTFLRTQHKILSKLTHCVLMNGTSFPNAPIEINSAISLDILSVISENDMIVKISDKPIYDSTFKESILHHDKGHNIPRIREQRIIIAFICGSDQLIPYYSH